MITVKLNLTNDIAKFHTFEEAVKFAQVLLVEGGLPSVVNDGGIEYNIDSDYLDKLLKL